MNYDRKQRKPRAHAAVFCVFSIAALWTSRAILLNPAAIVTLEPPAPELRGREAFIARLREADIRRNVTQIAYVSRILSSRPLDLFDGQMCFPTAGVAFGEHMLGEGILGLPAYLVWNDPVVTYNFVVTVRPLIGAVSMYALAYHWTGSVGVALIAGFLFGFHPTRLADLIHPSVVGNEWLPAILLSLDLLFTQRRWRHAFLLSVLASLQMLESLYVVLQCAIVVPIYGSYLLWRHRRAILALLPKLTFVAGSLAVTGIWVFGPYLEARDVWGILQGRRGIPTPPRYFWIGYRSYPGSCLLVLASLGLLDRLRGAWTKRGYDPRLPLALAGLVAVWFVVTWRVPWTELDIPPLRSLLRPWLPGLDGVRAPGNVFFATAVSLGLLAAFGVRALVANLGRKPRVIAMGLITTACVGEVFFPAFAERSFGRGMPSNAFYIRPPEGDLAAVRDLPPDPVLDFPLDRTRLIVLSQQVMLGSYHKRKQAACKASFDTPAQSQIAAIADRLPDPTAAQELWALGLRTIIFHHQKDTTSRQRTDRIIGALSGPLPGPHLTPISEGRSIRVFKLAAYGSVTTDLTSLSPVVSSQRSRSAGKIQLRFVVRGGEATFRYPDPVQPTGLLVIWYRHGTIVESQMIRALLPLALAPGRTTEVTVESRAPRAPGTYDVTLTLADDPKVIVGAQRVVVMRRLGSGN